MKARGEQPPGKVRWKGGGHPDMRGRKKGTLPGETTESMEARTRVARSWENFPVGPQVHL